MKKASIYTGGGDCGSTSLANGTRVPKDHPRVQAYGTLDELNAHLGLLAASLDDSRIIDFIERIENNIFSIGCYLAAEECKENPLSDSDIERLEKEIDTICASLPPLKSFILPPGNEQAARANVCRTICRRGERAITTLAKDYHISPQIMAYINRLSDYLFALQRQLTHGEEKMWQKPCK